MQTKQARLRGRPPRRVHHDTHRSGDGIEKLSGCMCPHLSEVQGVECSPSHISNNRCPPPPTNLAHQSQQSRYKTFIAHSGKGVGITHTHTHDIADEFAQGGKQAATVSHELWRGGAVHKRWSKSKVSIKPPSSRKASSNGMG